MFVFFEKVGSEYYYNYNTFEVHQIGGYQTPQTYRCTPVRPPAVSHYSSSKELQNKPLVN